MIKKRIPILLETPAAVRFVSIEPMLGRVLLTSYDEMQTIQSELGWVICGAETGPGARQMDLAWARDLRDQCREAGVPFFFKSAGPGNEIPPDLMIRERPKVKL